MTDNASRKRRADGYEPRFDLDLAYGKQGELIVTDISQALRNGSVEVKRDSLWSRTGNLYVEYECRRAVGWTPSGIATSDAELWAFVLGDSELTIVVPTGLLRDIARHFYRLDKWYRVEVTHGSHPTKGVRIPIVKLFDLLATRERRGVA